MVIAASLISFKHRNHKYDEKIWNSGYISGVISGLHASPNPSERSEFDLTVIACPAFPSMDEMMFISVLYRNRSEDKCHKSKSLSFVHSQTACWWVFYFRNEICVHTQHTATDVSAKLLSLQCWRSIDIPVCSRLLLPNTTYANWDRRPSEETSHNLLSWLT